ncbi:hypothetical protein [Pseudonocardia sp. TRM90224]|uniref:hypothetical protein n=1 Tax=Pseudonocardia sp. TRM90224 TaxID=2812678 RepID=UPI001E621FEB|nr:hypothetical protein [Pseudonocardia sp. TRM90224]
MSIVEPLATLYSAGMRELGRLAARARSESSDQLAIVAGRAAAWVDDTADRVDTLCASTAGALGNHAEEVGARVAGRFGRWSDDLADRIVRVGADKP